METPTDRQETRTRYWFWLVLLAYVAYAGFFVYRTSITLHGTQYFLLFDDEMISMRYARNLVAGHGLVWNPGGARVEGFTNPLWVGYMALIHLLPLPDSKICLVIQVTGVILLMVNLYYVRKIASAVSDGDGWVTATTVLMTAFYLPLNTWGLEGLEVSALVLAISIAVWKAIESMESGRAVWPFHLLLALSTFVRLDMAVPAVAMMAFLSIWDRSRRRSHLWVGMLALGLCLLVQTGLRFYYYGELLPNTYYLKMTGYPLALRIARGIYVAVKFAYRMNLLVFLLAWIPLLFRRDRKQTLLLWIFAFQMAYSIYVGGDAWEPHGGSNRYLTLAMPLFFAQLCVGIRMLVSHLTPSQDRDHRWSRACVEWGLFLICFLSANAIYGGRALLEMVMIHRPFDHRKNSENLEIAMFLRKATTVEAKVSVVMAGTIPYFCEREYVDILGKCDPFVSHLKMRTTSGLKSLIYFYPGHLKYDYAYSIGRNQPDVVVGVFRNGEEAMPMLDANYERARVAGIDLYMRKGSPNVRWDCVQDINSFVSASPAGR